MGNVHPRMFCTKLKLIRIYGITSRKYTKALLDYPLKRDSTITRNPLTTLDIAMIVSCRKKFGTLKTKEGILVSIGN